MTANQIASLKARLLSMHAACQAAPSVHNSKIMNAVAKQLFEATGEICVKGEWVKVA